MRLKAVKLLVLVVLLGVLAGCATLKDTWNKATPQERTRIIVSDLQATLKASLIVGGAYVKAHPEKQGIWKQKALPIAELVNKKLLVAGTQITSWEQVTTEVGPLLLEINTLILNWGVSQAELNAEKERVK